MKSPPAPIVLAFLFGVAFIGIFQTILSYQASNCSDYQQAPRDIAHDPLRNPSAGGHENKSKSTSESIACGIAGLPATVRQFMNHNEGFSVGGFTFFLVVVTAWLVYATTGLRESTDKLWEASERQHVATQRPWVKVDSIRLASDLIFENGEGWIDLLVTVSNKGNSPGLRVRVDAKIVARNQISLLEEQAAFAANFRTDPMPSEFRPEITSWPGDQIEFRTRAWMNSLDMRRFKPLANNTPFPISLLTIVGCVDYEFSFSPGHHQTGLIYDLHLLPQFSRWDQQIAGAVPLEGRTPKEHLALSISIAGTGPVS